MDQMIPEKEQFASSRQEIQRVQIKVVVLLYLVKQVTELEMCGSFAKRHISYIFDKLLVVGRISTNVSPKHNPAGALVHPHGFHYEHDVLYIFGELFDNKLIVVNQSSLLNKKNVQFKPINIDI